MDVFQLLCAFGATPDIEIVIPWLPEVFATSDEAPRDGLFHGFQSSSEYWRSGSVTRRWTCSGITTYPTTSNR